MRIGYVLKWASHKNSARFVVLAKELHDTVWTNPVAEFIQELPDVLNKAFPVSEDPVSTAELAVIVIFK